jgi:hypothetical protein
VTLRIRLLVLFVLVSSCLTLRAAPPPEHDHFRVAIYIPVFVVDKMKDPAWLQKSWDEISSQLKVDKVYIESYRSGDLADDALLQSVKHFFVAHGVAVAGGIAFTAQESNQFQSFCYTDAKDREYVKHVSEVTARNFDEIILDDFFFNSTKSDSDIAAKGDASWTNFRLHLMDDVSRELVLGAARAVNPKVKIIIKFPNWYEHFQGDGYDLDVEPKIYDGIYTGTETRDPVTTDQHLQQYESYEIIRYFDNIKPGGNGGGWVDIYGTRYVDRYAEQLWDTMLAKTPEIMLFNYGDLVLPAQPGNRNAWSSLHTSFDYADMEKLHTTSGAPGQANMATVASYSLAQVNTVVGKLGNPIGLASYKPYQSSGEDFLHNYLGMIGIPIELYPQFPSDAGPVLLTESAKYDPRIVSEIQAHLQKGQNVIITSGLLRALQGKGIEQIAEIYDTGNVLKMQDYWSPFGPGGPNPDSGLKQNAIPDVLVPEIAFMTNDAWPVVRGIANGHGAPLLLMDRYSKGILYVLTIPENFNDLYLLPQPLLTSIKQFVLRDFPVRLDAPSQVSLFVYDNHTFVVQSFLDKPAQVMVSVLGTYKHLRNLATGQVIVGKAAAPIRSFGRTVETPQRTEFHIEVKPHSFVGLVEED